MNEYTFDYEFINQYDGTRSPTGTVEGDLTTAYFFRCLYQRLLSTIHFDIPKEWNKVYFKNVLFGLGFIGIIQTPEYGIIPQICTLTGYGLYRQPTRLMVSQPLVSFDGIIGDKCELIRLTPDYRGICDIVEHYAIKLAKCSTSIDVSLVNSRLGMLALAKNKNAAETLKVVAEKLSSGEPMIVTDKILKDGIEKQESIFTTAFDPAKNYITDKLLNDYWEILAQFDREIGIPSVDEKKERRIETEIETMNADNFARLSTWNEILKESMENVREVFPDLKISYRIRKGGEDFGTDSADDFNWPL